MITHLTLKLFNKAIPTNEVLNFDDVNKLACKYGYLIHPDVCNRDVYSWLQTNAIDYNSTFYKKWNDVISKDRFELYFDQLLHYASTYGTEFTGEVYLPEGIIELPDVTNLKLILPITEAEVVSNCEKMLFSGIALKQETIEDILGIFDALNHDVDILKVKNKEAKMFLYKKLNILPEEPVEMVRFLVYLATEKTLLIKNKETINAIKSSSIDVSDVINKYGLVKLSAIFLRFKPIFLAFKSNKNNAATINKLRRLATENHVAAVTSYFDSLLSTDKIDLDDLQNKLSGLNNFKKISILQSILIRKKSLDKRVFLIRNQKVFIKEELVNFNEDYLNKVFEIIYSSLVNSLRSKACKVKMPVGINLTIPSSEKSFVGNYPLGTSFDLSDSHNIIGINWKSIDGADDLDLKLIDINGTQYGWNANYKNKDNTIVFSGDMTYATPEATEMFYSAGKFNPCIVKVNLYSGLKGSKFSIFLAKEDVVDFGRNYMVNPNNIIFSAQSEMDSSEKSLGVLTGDKFIFAQFRTGSGKVAGDSVTNQYTDYALTTLDCYLNLKKVLLDSGFELSDENPDIDLSTLSKNVLIELLS